MPLLDYYRAKMKNNSPPPEPVSHLIPEKNCCKYPFGDPTGRDFRFCNRRVNIGAIYCNEHRDLCYVPVPVKMSKSNKQS